MEAAFRHLCGHLLQVVGELLDLLLAEADGGAAEGQRGHDPSRTTENRDRDGGQTIFAFTVADRPASALGIVDPLPEALDVPFAVRRADGDPLQEALGRLAAFSRD